MKLLAGPRAGADPRWRPLAQLPDALARLASPILPIRDSGQELADQRVHRRATFGGVQSYGADHGFVDAEGNEFPVQGEAYLCRCGQSEEKPFCDGSHNLAGFSDACRA